MSQHFSGPTTELRPVVEPSPEEMTIRLDLPAQPDNHPLPNTSVPEPTPLPAAPDDERDFYRVDKMAYNSALALFSISVTLLLSNPEPVDHPGRFVVYAASTALACLSLIAVVGLIYYSIISHPSAQLAKVQKMAMGFSEVTLVLSALSRLALFMPFLLFLVIMASVILLTCLLRLLVYLAQKIKAT